MWLSVIVPVHNGGRTVGACVRAVRDQLGGDGEVLCVDDASTDDSAAAAAGAGARVIRAAGNVGAARARNLGAREAEGDVLLFLDADVVLQPGALAALRAAFDGGYDAVVGHYTERTPAPGFFSQYQNYYTYYNHDRQAGEINWFWTAMGAVRRAAFEEVGGFSEHFRGASAEDMQLGYELSRAGRRIVLAKDVRGAHDHRHTFRSLVRNDLKKSAAWSNVFLRLNRGGRYKHGFTGAANRVSLAAAFLVLVGAAAAFAWPAAGAVLIAASLAAFVAVNAGFYAFIARRAGVPFLAGAVPFHFFTFYLVALGVIRGTLTYLFGARVS